MAPVPMPPPPPSFCEADEAEVEGAADAAEREAVTIWVTVRIWPDSSVEMESERDLWVSGKG
jgi:hypothetical protein